MNIATGIVFQHHILFLTYEWAQNVECYTTLGWRGLPGKTLQPIEQVMEKIYCCEYSPRSQSWSQLRLEYQQNADSNEIFSCVSISVLLVVEQYRVVQA